MGHTCIQYRHSIQKSRCILTMFPGGPGSPRAPGGPEGPCQKLLHCITLLSSTSTFLHCSYSVSLRSTAVRVQLRYIHWGRASSLVCVVGCHHKSGNNNKITRNQNTKIVLHARTLARSLARTHARTHTRTHTVTHTHTHTHTHTRRRKEGRKEGRENILTAMPTSPAGPAGPLSPGGPRAPD